MKPNELPGDFRWEYVKDIGQGGQAKVWEVKDRTEDLPHPCAMKVLNRSVRPKAVERFIREIELIKALDHPNIIKLLDHSKDGDSFHYYIMECISGAQPLKKYLINGKSPYAGNPVAAIEMFVQISEALGACEQKGIAHRDLSPGNILVIPDGTIKVIDFGIAQVDNGDLVTLTTEGENFGTLNYRAPECEHAVEGKIDVRSDLYSAGKILWSAMTSREVFPREVPAFTNQSMKRIFPEDPDTWHLFEIYEHTIRLEPRNRWESASLAVKEAKRVLSNIKAGIPPFEILARCCPVCRSLHVVEYKAKPNVLRGDNGIERTCGRCGHVSFFLKHVIEGEEERRKNLR